MRLLSERADHDCQGIARSNPESDGPADPRRHVSDALSMHDVLPHSGGDQACCENDACERRDVEEGGARMMPFTKIPRHIEEVLSSRREFLKKSGLLVVSFGAAAAGAGSILMPGSTGLAAAQQPAGPYPDPDYRQLDSWIVIRQDNTATFYVGKTDCGQGTGTAFRQMMSDELDIAYDKTTCIMGSTDVTVDQGGSGEIGRAHV